MVLSSTYKGGLVLALVLLLVLLAAAPAYSQEAMFAFGLGMGDLAPPNSDVPFYTPMYIGIVNYEFSFAIGANFNLFGFLIDDEGGIINALNATAFLSFGEDVDDMVGLMIVAGITRYADHAFSGISDYINVTLPDDPLRDPYALVGFYLNMPLDWPFARFWVAGGAAYLAPFDMAAPLFSMEFVLMPILAEM